MSDADDLAAIRARDARWVDPLPDYNFPPTMGDAIKDCRTLLRMLDEAREGDEESSKLVAHYRDHCLRLEKVRDELRAQLDDRTRELAACKTARDGFIMASDSAHAEVIALQAELARLRERYRDDATP